MYHYDEREQQAWRQRLAAFTAQTQAYLAGTLAADAYCACAAPLGVRLQRNTPSVRIALPYGLLAPAQLRALAQAARRWDKGYVRFAAGPSVLLNWPRLRDVPALLAALADAGLHGGDEDVRVPGDDDTAMRAHDDSALRADRATAPAAARTPHLADNTEAGLRFTFWRERQLQRPAMPGFAAVAIPARMAGMAPGDTSADQLDAIADLAQRYGGALHWRAASGELVMLAVPLRALFPLWQQLALLKLAN